ncbi:AfsR/SARP family transcriptional regulator [Streptomyces sp. P6-2-1]|uniref:AfsR/SARP family transcriptional regulator n=1 Tax=Streptomyces sp. P6-2-1 TaxID=3422591 RepID=UPI003D35EFE6
MRLPLTTGTTSRASGAPFSGTAARPAVLLGAARVPDVSFSLLGPLRVRVDGRDVPFPESRQLTVLAVLLTEADRAVPVSRLVDAVWGGTPPVTAEKQIQTCVWRLRKAWTEAGGPPDLIETVRGGYLLRVSDAHLDTRQFEAHRERGRAAAPDNLEGTVEHYRAALALFRGEPLAGLGSRGLAPVAAYWAERRLALLEECFDAELALGRHRELVGELSLLVEEHPLREQLRGRLMTALYLSDRRADALAAYRAGRAALVSRVGLDPCAGLQDLHQRIIDGRPVRLYGGTGGGAGHAAREASGTTR